MDRGESQTRRPAWPQLALLWLLGIDLRLTILAVPPVLPLIHRDLHLDEKLVAALTGLPVLLFGLIAIPGSLMIARIGARRAAIVGVLIVSIASALRGAGPSVPMLFGMTALMGAGVAIMQPALPTLVGQWFPQRVSLATALYANGLLVGEMLPASLTIPLILPMLHGSWQASFVFWSAPVLVTAFLVLFLTPHTEQSRWTSACAVVAGLARHPHLAARLHAGGHGGAVFRLQRLPAGLPARDRASRAAECSAHRAE